MRNLTILILLLLSTTLQAGLVEDSAILGGIVVFVGCDDTKLILEAGENERFLVQVLSTDPASIRKARQIVAEKELSDRVWVSHFDGQHLPFADNVVNLLVVRDARYGIRDGEIERVLAPRGVLLAQENLKPEALNLRPLSAAPKGWFAAQKPVPPQIDEWTHHLHDPSGNAVAADSVVGPPEHLKWAAKPLWSKHHHTTASLNAMVSAQGRIFSIVEESPVSIDPEIMPDQWNLVARDAFNGVLLWRIPISLWGTKGWNETQPHGRNNQPTHIGRRLVAVGDRVYVTLGYNAPVSELDAATGEVLRVLEGTKHTDAILCKDGKLILAINKEAQAASRDKPPVRKELAVLDLGTGKMLWRKGNYTGLQSKTGLMDRINHLTVAVGEDRLFFFANREEITCLSLKDGADLWTIKRPMVEEHKMRYELRITDRCTLVVNKDVLFLAQPEPAGRVGHKKGIARIYAFATDTGAPLWNRELAEWGWAEPPDVFVIKDELWIFDLKTFSLLAIAPASGEELRRWKTAEAMDRGHHHRCYRNRSAENFVLTSHRGLELFDLKTGTNNLNPFIRGACQFGYLPCNGLIYTTPHPCSCFIDGKLNGMLALGPEDTGATESKVGDAGRLVKGLAYGKVTVKEAAPDAEAWPTYRHDSARSGSTPTRVPQTLKNLWSVSIKGQPTACVVGEGTVLVASKATRRLHAFEEKTGAPLWNRVMNGSIDSPPTIYRGTALCGGRDGFVTCLRLTDGEVVWRFRAAPVDRWIHVYGTLESASPVFGSVLVNDGAAYFTAGRSSYLDGGIFAYALNPVTGEMKEEKQFSTDGQSPDACLSDILVSSGASIYMRNRAVFGPGKAKANFLFSRSGLLDEEWFNRAPWSLGRETRGAHNNFWSSRGAGQNMEPLTGQYIVHDDQVAFSVVAASGDRDRGIFKPAKTGYRLNCARVDGAPRGKALWSVQVPVRIMAMVNSPDALFAAGTPDVVDQSDPWGALAGRKGGRLLVISKADGKILSSTPMPAAPCLDGLAAAHGRLFISTVDGKITCMGM